MTGSAFANLPLKTMSEIRIIAKAVPKPGNEQRVKELLRGMIAPSLAEPGVLTYDLHETGDGKQFYFFEAYTSPAAFADHKASAHFQGLSSVLPDLLAEPLEIIELTQVK